MPDMTMRERILAVVQGRELDRVPFVMYQEILPTEPVVKLLGRDNIGFLKWSRIHRAEHPNCRFESEEYYVDGRKWQRNTLHTPKGSLYEERAFGDAYGSSSVREHYIKDLADYEIFWSYLEDSIILENYAQFYKDAADLGDDGYPLVAVERSPYQQLWIKWVSLDDLQYHMVDDPDRMAHTFDLLTQRARQTFELVYRSPVAFIDFPDNITAPPIGIRNFKKYCVPMYNELGNMLAEKNVPIFVHMDGDIKPFWQAITDSKVGGIDSFAPKPDNDTSVAEAVALWPEMRLFMNFPSSVHLRSAEGVREEADNILQAGGHTGRLQIQISENVPMGVWETSLPAIAAAVQDFGKP